MLFSKEYKKRAVELSQECTAKEVSRKLSEEFPDKQPPDERTIRRWRREQREEQKEKDLNHVDLKSKEEHRELLVDIVNLLLENEVGKVFGIPSEGNTPEKDDYTIISDKSDFEKIPRGYLVERIENNIDYTCKTYSAWDFWECFFPHLMAEALGRQDFREFYENHTIEFIDTLRVLSQRKTFKGSCPVCKDW